MNCTNCKGQRILELSAKCNDDHCTYSIGNIHENSGYIPSAFGIGDGEYIEFNLCLNCGQVQGQFPRPISDLEKDVSDDEITMFFNNYFVEGKSFSLLPPRKYDAVNTASGLCKRFGYWIEDFIDENNGPMTDPWSKPKMPSVQRFIKMYRDNNLIIKD